MFYTITTLCNPQPYLFDFNVLLQTFFNGLRIALLQKVQILNLILGLVLTQTTQDISC